MKRLILLIAATLMLCGCDVVYAQDSVLDFTVNKIIMAESSGRASAIGDEGKARGLMQLQYNTWKRFTKRPFSDAFIPEVNRQVGSARVSEIMEKYNTQNPAYIAYRYNCGDYTKLSFERWKLKQPNKVYRSLYKGEIK